MKSLSPYLLASVPHSKKLQIPLCSSRVHAGFPSPAEDYIEKRLDVNDLVIKHPAATFFIRAEGDSMQDAGIQSGDILIVDRSITATHGKIIIAVVDGEFTVKRLHIESGKISLVPANSRFSTLKISPEADFQVWGVVTFIIHQAT